jgi:uncharacterized protein YqeY
MYAKVNAEIKAAMIAKDVDKKNVLKQVKAKADAKAKEKKCAVTDEILISAIEQELKQLNQTKDSISSRPDSDLYISTENKIKILTAYLPPMMTKEEIAAAIKEIVEKNPKAGKGLIGIVMKSLKGKAQNKDIKEVYDSLF